MIDIDAEKVEIERLVKRVEAAENQHDVETMLAEMIDDPLLYLCGFPPVRGQEAVRQLYHGLLSRKIPPGASVHLARGRGLPGCSEPDGAYPG